MEGFDRLANRSDLKEIEDQQISRFVHGLRVFIWDQVSLQTLYTLNEVVTLSKKIEYQHLRAGLKFSNRNSEPSSSTANKGKQLLTPSLDQNSSKKIAVVITGPHSTTHSGDNSHTRGALVEGPSRWRKVGLPLALWQEI